MVKTIFYLGTCDTCKRIIKQIEDVSQFDLREIKSAHISGEELDEIQKLSGLKYDDLFNKRARKYKEIKKDVEGGDDNTFRDLILSEYTFLKRPIIVYGDTIFVGNAKGTVASMISTVNA